MVGILCGVQEIEMECKQKWIKIGEYCRRWSAKNRKRRQSHTNDVSCSLVRITLTIRTTYTKYGQLSWANSKQKRHPIGRDGEDNRKQKKDWLPVCRQLDALYFGTRVPISIRFRLNEPRKKSASKEQRSVYRILMAASGQTTVWKWVQKIVGIIDWMLRVPPASLLFRKCVRKSFGAAINVVVDVISTTSKVLSHYFPGFLSLSYFSLGRMCVCAVCHMYERELSTVLWISCA